VVHLDQEEGKEGKRKRGENDGRRKEEVRERE
jgi:hypothetical protein